MERTLTMDYTGRTKLSNLIGTKYKIMIIVFNQEGETKEVESKVSHGF